MANDNFDLPRPTDPVPSSTSAVINDDAKVLDYVVNSTGTVVTRTGKTLLTLDEAIKKFGFGIADFTFTIGGTLNSLNLLVSNSPVDGFLYKYVGAGDAPIVVAPATDPTVSSDWQEFSATVHNFLSGRGEANSHPVDAIDFSSYGETSESVTNLRKDLSSNNGNSLVKTYEDESLSKVTSRQIRYDNRVNQSKTASRSELIVRSNQRKPKLVILLGQSNAEGRGTVSDANLANDVTGYKNFVNIWTGSAFETLRVPTTSSDPLQNNDALPGRYGIELAIGNYAEVDDDLIHMVKVTEGGTFMGQWLATEDIIPVGGGDPNDPENDGDLSIADPQGGVLDNEAWTKVQNAKIAMDSLYGAGNYEDVLVMMQGEANGTSATQKPRFKRQRLTFNARWRTRLGSTLRIVNTHILALDSDYIDINGYINEIEYEDPLNYVVGDTAYLPTDDGIHLNYLGLCQAGKSVYNEIQNPTTKRILYPSGHLVTVTATANLTILDYYETVIVTGTDPVNYTNKSAAKDGRRLLIWRKDAGAGFTIRHDFGDPNVYANFRFQAGVNTGVSAGKFVEFIASDGHWYEKSLI